MKKKVSISIVFFILIFVIIDHNIKSPSNMVETYFENIKIGTSNPITLSMFSSIDSLNSKSEGNTITDLLINSLSKLDVKILDESISGDTSTVTLRATGISLSTILNEVYAKLKTKDCLEKIEEMKEDELENYFTDLLLDSINSAEIEERTISLNLTKVNRQWQIDENDGNLQEILWGITKENLAKMDL